MALYDCTVFGPCNVLVSLQQQLQDSWVMSSGGLAVHLTFFFFSDHLLPAEAFWKLWQIVVIFYKSGFEEIMLSTLAFKTERKRSWMFLWQYSFDIQPWQQSLLAHRQLSWAIVVSILCSSCDPAEIPFGPLWKDMSDDSSNHLASKIRNWWQAH